MEEWGKSQALVIALVNQKGGCGKTTTAVNLGASLAVRGERVLLVDMDPQANATVSFGIDPATLSHTIYHVLVDHGEEEGPIPLEMVMIPTNVQNLDLVPSSIDLASAELELVTRIGRENTLRKKLMPMKERYTYVLIDTPPSLGLLTLNALVASDAVIIPIQTHYYALLGMRQLLRTLRMVKEEIGHHIEILGVLPTMYDARTMVSREILEGIREYFGEKVFRTAIHFNIKLVESSMAGVPLFLHNPSSRGAQDYLQLADEVIALAQGTSRTPARP
ncbi:MAG: ParA family protein [Armatimonadota bacterium]|nr:ParA family protein [Armatimonadota bacterium]MDR5704170.1 ParA family protein [Armatimonadota bacterium]